MSLIFHANHIQALVAQAETVYPEECCGLLLGVHDPEHDRRTVYDIRPLTNDWTEAVNPFADRDRATPISKGNRYWVDPQALMIAQRDARDRGWIILGVYHSHPDHPAVPSERDRELAWSEYSYPILSVVDGTVAALRSWRLTEAGQFREEAIATDDGNAKADPMLST
jgi:proteasome lid subunit RPN8/RPN11